MQDQKSLSLSLLLIVLMCFSSCTFFKDQPEEGHQRSKRQVKSISNPTTQVAITELEKVQPENLNDIEITWKVPDEMVEGYVIRYGSSRDNLENEVTIYTSELESLPDEKHGMVFRYYITDIPADQPIFTEVTAFQGELQSEASDVYEAHD